MYRALFQKPTKAYLIHGFSIRVRLRAERSGFESRQGKLIVCTLKMEPIELLFVRFWVPLSEAKRVGPEVNHFHAMPNLWMCGAVPCSPLCAFMAWAETNLSFTCSSCWHIQLRLSGCVDVRWFIFMKDSLHSLSCDPTPTARMQNVSVMKQISRLSLHSISCRLLFVIVNVLEAHYIVAIMQQ